MCSRFPPSHDIFLPDHAHLQQPVCVDEKTRIVGRCPNRLMSMIPAVMQRRFSYSYPDGRHFMLKKDTDVQISSAIILLVGPSTMLPFNLKCEYRLDFLARVIPFPNKTHGQRKCWWHTHRSETSTAHSRRVQIERGS